MGFHFGRRERLLSVILISGAFCLAEIGVGIKTNSLALIADAFHYMNDLVAFCVSLYALHISERNVAPQDLTFGYQRAQLLGAFFNGVFLLALGISIFVQSIQRFAYIEEVKDPKLVLIMGCIGLTLNIISAVFLHEHHHGHDHGQDDNPPGLTDDSRQTSASASARYGETDVPHQHAHHRHHEVRIKAPGRDLGMMGVLVHVICDAFNNIGVIIAALVIWRTDYDARYYADPGTSMGISIMIFLSSIPLVKNSGGILLQSAPRGVGLADIKHDLEKVPGIESVHELHVWQLDQKKTIATAHIVMADQTVSEFMKRAKTVGECLHAYGIHSATIQPELAIAVAPSGSETLVSSSSASMMSGTVRRRPAQGEAASCQLLCGKGLCESLTCCSTPVFAEK